MKLLTFFFIFIIKTKLAYAYPHFIGLGYSSCLTCHYNPLGNGPINDYGRAVFATGVASNHFYDDDKPEELIASESGFFGKEIKNKYFRPFIGLRGMLLKSNLGETNSQSDFILMQTEGNLVFKAGAKDQFLMSATFGYAPIPRSLQNTTAGDSMKKYRTREHYIAFRPKPSFGFYLGLLDKPFGIRLAEHNSYSRVAPQLTMDDQSHGLLFHLTHEKFEFSSQYYIGNLVNEPDIRKKGISNLFEYSFFENSRLGFSYLSEKNEYLKLNAMALSFRSQITYGTSIMTEVGKVTKTPALETNSSKNETYALIHNHIKTTRGLYLLNAIEYYKSSLDKSYRVRFGPGIQYFPFQKLELRFDVYNTRNFGQETVVKDRWDLLMQLHAWI